MNLEDVWLSLDSALPCGLIVNELVANCIRHAFPAGRRGTIRLDLVRESNGRLRLTVTDDGVGFPAGLKFESVNTLGLQLVTALTGQLGGTVARRGNGSGSIVEVRFPEERKQ